MNGVTGYVKKGCEGCEITNLVGGGGSGEEPNGGMRGIKNKGAKAFVSKGFGVIKVLALIDDEDIEESAWEMGGTGGEITRIVRGKKIMREDGNGVGGNIMKGLTTGGDGSKVTCMSANFCCKIGAGDFAANVEYVRVRFVNALSGCGECCE